MKETKVNDYESAWNELTNWLREAMIFTETKDWFSFNFLDNIMWGVESLEKRYLINGRKLTINDLKLMEKQNSELGQLFNKIKSMELI